MTSHGFMLSGKFPYKFMAYSPSNPSKMGLGFTDMISAQRHCNNMNNLIETDPEIFESSHCGNGKPEKWIATQLP